VLKVFKESRERLEHRAHLELTDSTVLRERPEPMEHKELQALKECKV
jgi:hypothetical protein